MADRYSGPAVTERLAAEGAVVVGDTGRYQDPDESGRVVADAGRIDVLVVNLIARWKPTSAVDHRRSVDERLHRRPDRPLHGRLGHQHLTALSAPDGT